MPKLAFKILALNRQGSAMKTILSLYNSAVKLNTSFKKTYIEPAITLPHKQREPI